MIAGRTWLTRISVLTTSSVLLSCSGEPTQPVVQPPAAPSSVQFSITIPDLIQSSAFADFSAIDKVHAILKRTTGAVVLDTALAGRLNGRVVAGTLEVKSPNSASGESLTLELSLLDAHGGTLLRAAPVTVTIMPSSGGQGPATASAIAEYAGPGALARTVKISPRSLTVNAGDPFTFSAATLDAAGASVANVPLEWLALDPASAVITTNTSGTGRALGQRGVARIVARLVTGQADTVSVTVAATATTLSVVSGSGQSAKVGKPLAPTLVQPIVTRVLGADGLGVAGISVTYAAQNGGSVVPAIATSDANGLAQASWTLGNAAGAQTATATAQGLTGSPLTFTATGVVPAATRLVFTAAPTAGVSLSPSAPLHLVVSALDIDGDLVTTFNGTVTLTIASGPALAAIGGSAQATAANGIATFDNASLTTSGTGYVLTASASGLASATTPSFAIQPNASSRYTMTVVGGNGQQGLTGAQLLPVYVQVSDAGRQGVMGVPVTFSIASGGGTLSPAITQTFGQGSASTVWTLGPAVGTQSITASTADAPSVTITATAMPRPPHFVFVVQPAVSQTAGVAITPVPTVELRTENDVLVATYNGPVTLGFGSNPANGSYSGTTTVNAVNGVATFPGVSLNRVGSYQLAAISSGYLYGPSTPFAVQRGTAATLRLQTGDNQVGAAGTTLAFPLTYSVLDVGGNGVPLSPITFTLTGGGSVTPPSTTTDVNAGASVSWTLGASGAQTLTASSPGVASVTASATIGGPRLGITGTITLGMRQQSYAFDSRVSLPVNASAPVVVNLVSLDPSIATVPSSVTVPAGSASANFVVTAHDVPGTAQIRASSPTFTDVTTSVVVTRPTFRITSPTSLWTTSPRSSFLVYAIDATGQDHIVTEDVVVSLGTSTPGIIAIDVPSVRILAGDNVASANVTPLAAGQGIITASDARTAPYAYATSTSGIDVEVIPAFFGFSSRSSLGLDQFTTGTLDLGYNPTTSLTTPVIYSAVRHTTLTPTVVTHAAGQARASLQLTAVSLGTDTLTATPPGQASVTQVITVGKGLFDVITANPLRVGDSTQVYFDLRNPGGAGGVFAAIPTTLTLTPSAGVRLVSGGTTSVPVTSLTLPVGASRASAWLKGVASGPASVAVAAPNYVTYVWPLGVSP